VPSQAAKKLDPRQTPASRPSSARSRRSGNFNWKPSQPRNGLVEKHAPGSAARASSTSLLDTGDSAAAEELQNSDGMEKAVGSNPTVPRPRSRNPWTITALTAATFLVGIVLLGIIVESLVTRQLDPKGCRMSYMRPSYARLNEFDTEHTRFASKYSLYLYREQGIDEDVKVSSWPVLASGCGLTSANLSWSL
jgi:glycosylphosphatidylinositol deacylase